MEKTLDLSKTIYELSKEDPDIIPIMLQAGFSEIANPLMLATAGRVMTIPQARRCENQPGHGDAGIQAPRLQYPFRAG